MSDQDNDKEMMGTILLKIFIHAECHVPLNMQQISQTKEKIIVQLLSCAKKRRSIDSLGK